MDLRDALAVIDDPHLAVDLALLGSPHRIGVGPGHDLVDLPGSRPRLIDGHRGTLTASWASTAANTWSSVIRSVRYTIVANIRKSMSPARNTAATRGNRSRIASA
jgi:hypothetical protein